MNFVATAARGRYTDNGYKSMINTKIKQFMRLPRLAALSALALLIVVSLQHPLNAQTVTQGYGSDQPIQSGMIVNLKKNDATKVELSTTNSIDHIQGVAVDANDAPVTLSSDVAKVFVATTGHFDVFVSTQNGPIKPGDYITVSGLDGVGMKSGTKEPVIVGHALASFDGKAGAISTTSVKDSAGVAHQVSLGRIQVDVGVARNPNFKSPASNIPEFLQKAATAIAGKPVPAVRIYLGITIFLVSTIVATSLLYGGVRSGIISIGRNPLSKKSIIKGMMQVVLVGLTIFISGIFAVYLLLKI